MNTHPVKLASRLIVVILFAPSLAHAFLLRGSVVGNGGSTGSNATSVLRGTVGQAAVGGSGNPSFILCSGFWCFGGSRVVAVGDPGDPAGGADLPTELSFGLPAPNPSRGFSRLALALPKPARVSFTVYDLAGRQVGETVSQQMSAGRHQLTWRAPVDRSGVYFGRLMVDGDLTAERRIVLVR